MTPCGGSRWTDIPAAARRPPWPAVVALLTVVAIVGTLAPWARVPLAPEGGFVAVVLTATLCFDALSVAFLLVSFRDSGDRRVLVLAAAYLVALLLAAGYALAFPLLFLGSNLLGATPSTAVWLWTLWHCIFPVMLGAALAPWPARWTRMVAPPLRQRLAWLVGVGSVAGSALLVVGVLALEHRLPTLIVGTDFAAFTAWVGPEMLPMIVGASAIAAMGAWRLGSLGWCAALAASALTGDSVLSLAGEVRYSLGWYAGRSLTVLSAAAVLAALLAQFSATRRQLATESDHLRVLLVRTEELERLQEMLLGHMTDGVLLHDGTGQIVAANPAAERLLGLTIDELRTQRPGPGWRLIHPDGGNWRHGDLTPVQQTLATGRPIRAHVLGVLVRPALPRWLSVDTAIVGGADDRVHYVVTTMIDITQQHARRLLERAEHRQRRARVQAVLAEGGPSVVLQPIVNLETGAVVGAEALSRFTQRPWQPPDRWFADAAAAGVGLELELAAISNALALAAELPPGAYLSINAAPATVTSGHLHMLLAGVQAGRIVVELTEHAQVADYPPLLSALKSLRDNGVRIAVDDAGAGHASLRHILNLQPDIIKLDIALVHGIHADPARQALTAALLVFAARTGAVILAEGIETYEELAALRRLGVTYGQGYHVARPTPLPLPASIALQQPDDGVLSLNRGGSRAGRLAR